MDKDEEEECIPCKYQVAAGMSLNICKDIEKQLGVDCDRLATQVDSGKLDPLKMMKSLISKARRKELPEASELQDLLLLAQGKEEK